MRGDRGDFAGRLKRAGAGCFLDGIAAIIPAMKSVLFLCTGNYYRSRFAECVFNHVARQRGMPWRAESRGLRVQPEGVVNVGAISIFAVAGLRERKVAHEEPLRFPKQVSKEEMRAAAVVVALKEQEHRAMIEAQFPRLAGRVRYWHVHDLDVAMPSEALGELEQLVRGLAEELAGDAMG